MPSTIEQERGVGWAFGHAMIWGNRVTTRYRFPSAVEHVGRDAREAAESHLEACTASTPVMDFLRDGEIYYDEDKEDERREKARMLKHAGLIAVSFRRLFLGGLLPSRARFRFAGWEMESGVPGPVKLAPVPVTGSRPL